MYVSRVVLFLSPDLVPRLPPSRRKKRKIIVLLGLPVKCPSLKILSSMGGVEYGWNPIYKVVGMPVVPFRGPNLRFGTS